MKTYSQFDTTITPGVLTGISNLDDLLSVDKGFQSSVIFLTGTSGSGKTTLSKVIQKNISDTPTALYERETSSKSVAKQTRRVVINHSNALISDEKDFKTFTDFMNEVRKRGIKFVIIDSLQTAAVDFEINEGMSEKDSQMKVLQDLIEWKKETGGTAILIGMVNKDGDFSGVNKIKHMADCHLHLVFDKVKNIRFMFTTKNRDNGTAKLFYEFVETDEVIEFFTEKEFELRGSNLKFEDYLLKQLKDFMNSVSKKNPNYEAFKADCNNGLEKIQTFTKIEFAIETIKLLEVLTKKYGMQN